MGIFKRMLCLMFLISLLTGCSPSGDDSGLKIAAPVNKRVPILGTWEISGIIKGSTDQYGEDFDKWLQKNVIFSDTHAAVGDYVIDNPKYQIKRVSSEEYLLYNRASFPQNFALPKSETEVVTINDKDLYFCEVLRLNDNELILEMLNDSFYLRKVADKVDRGLLEKIKQNAKDNNQNNTGVKEGAITSGVLMGLKTPKGIGDGYSYRTLWIAETRGQLHQTAQADGIFFPRRSGFWVMEFTRELKGSVLIDGFLSRNISAEGGKDSLDNSSAAQRRIQRSISYIGNDYMSVETLEVSVDSEGLPRVEKSSLGILPVDSLPNLRTVGMADIGGEAGNASMEWSRVKAIEGMGLKEQEILSKEQHYKSFGLERRMGHWFFKGRVNYQRQGQNLSLDYNINVIPPSKVVYYDELSIPWTVIKGKVPSAVDAFVSPNRKIALIITKNQILVYGLSKNNLDETPLSKIDLNQGETVIMAEWALGHYVKAWENTFLNYIRK